MRKDMDGIDEGTKIAINDLINIKLMKLATSHELSVIQNNS